MLCGGMQKKREREKKAAIMGELEELLELYQLSRGKGKMSQADHAIAVLTDTVEVVRKERKKCGLPDLAPRNTHPPAAKSRGHDYSTVKEKSDAVLASLPPPKSPPPSGGPSQGKREAKVALAADHRRAMLSSTTLGAMLVRVQDMMITEASGSLDLLCPGTREGWFRGYREQQLSLMVFSEDRPVVDRILAGARRGSLEVGLTQSCRLLRVNNDEFGSGCLLCSWVEVSLRVASVLPDSSAVLLTFDMTDEMRKPLETSADFWRRYYAPGSGVPDSISHLFLPVVDDPEWVVWHPGQDSASQSSVVHAFPGSDFSRTLSALGVSLLCDSTMALIKSPVGLIAHVDKDSDTSLVPRMMFVPHMPKNMLEKFTLSEDASRISFMIPFTNIRPDGTSQPMKMKAAGGKPLLHMMMAISVDAGDEHGITALITNAGRPQAGCTYNIACVFGSLFDRNKFPVFANFGASGWLYWKLKPEPGPVPGAKSTFKLFADSEMGWSDSLPPV
mmetsp:Transcript_8267/g.21366  ORF Transcript_8267/g.21366 Transcript_8267/m.21366 type:complete len:503 (-) Transcript_8267:317-1825(-)|eukprot:CAMPEP_0174921338 /NCGR_PEP_ID=MMETSP1355-20121228/5075_1 /TAXON_ID=464990 /ORGANISM="Hemiselmis tepida, Strain CCMP443" /LENGTH=502 /DNA_ID=CAMNT_0016166807 /DNA_START=118 /DNA_END=1626 /DNA_ORIENTATION=+